MIVQACLNGARPKGFHDCLPLSTEAMAQDSLRCIRAGASERHRHDRLAFRPTRAAAFVVDTGRA